MKRATTIYRFILLATLPLIFSGCTLAWNKATLSTNIKTGVTPSTELTAPSLQNQKAENTLTWKTYRNERYGFEVKYPCNTNESPCPSITEYIPQGAFEFEDDFPTKANSTYFYVATFNEASIERWNQFLASPDGREADGKPFEFTIQELDAAISSTVGQKCNLGFRCEVVVVAGHKALRVITNDWVGAKIEYLIPQGEIWFDLTQYFYDESTAFLLDSSKITPELQTKLSATEEVLKTFKFIR